MLRFPLRPPAWAKFLPAGVLAAALAACGSTGGATGDGGQAFTCPRVAAVGGADRLTRFAGSGHDPQDIAFEAEISQLAGTCGREDGAIDVALQIRFLAERGPTAEGSRARFRYFVAVADSDRRILTHESFDSAIEFRRNAFRAGVLEELAPRIPLPEGRTGGDYVIFVGFELTREEFEYNRQRP